MGDCQRNRGMRVGNQWLGEGCLCGALGIQAVIVASLALPVCLILQHQRAHGDPAALNYTFYQVISASTQAPPALRSLQNRCLTPGYYSTHLQRWLAHYPPGQVTSFQEPCLGFPFPSAEGFLGI